MITKQQQYELILKIYNSFEKNKIVKRAKVTSEMIEKFDIHYRYKRFEKYTLDNFISILLYAVYTKEPSSLTDYLKMLNKMSKEDLLQSITFTNKIINYESTITNDVQNILEYNDVLLRGGLSETSVHQIFKEGRISLITFYKYYEKYPEHVKGRILKKDLKKAEIFLSFLNLDLTKINLKEL
jgi:hypothetical protein